MMNSQELTVADLYTSKQRGPAVQGPQLLIRNRASHFLIHVRPTLRYTLLPMPRSSTSARAKTHLTPPIR
jgi:hypothetical protein